MKNVITKIMASGVVASLLTYYTCPVFAYFNEETVYSNLDSTGKNYKSSVTTIVEDENGTKTTQDETNEELPIETKITYYLDGKEIDCNKIIGKKGKVKIKLEFENKDKHGDLYTPFVVVAGLIIDNKSNTDIEIVNGKILTNGNSSIAVGVTLPGMKESLEIDEDKINIPSSIEITMKTNKFELGNIMIYASPKILSDLNISSNSFDEIFDQINALDVASKALENGATSLSDGIKTLDDGAVTLDNGILALDNGIDSLKLGSEDLNNGAIALKNGTAEFSTKAGELTNGINQIATGTNALNTQYRELDAGINSLSVGVNTLNEKIPVLVEGATALDSGILGLQTGITAIDNGVTNVNGGLEASIASLEQIINGYELAGMSDIQIQPLKDLKDGLISLKNGTDQIKIGIESQDSTNLGLLAGTQALKIGSETLKNGTVELQSGVGELANGVNTIKAGSEAVVDGISNLDVGTTMLATNTAELPGAINAIANGAANLQNGIAIAQSGINALSDGSKQLKDGSLRLTEGTLALVNGSQELSSGIKQFNSDGISKIVKLVKQDGKNLINKIQKLEELSNDYINFASDEKRNDIRFIAITDSINVESTTNSSKTDKNKSKK